MSSGGIPGFTDGDISRRRALKKLLGGEEPGEDDELDQWFKENPLSRPTPESNPDKKEDEEKKG
ncbi:MAG: hypothetical protein JXA49_11175 [Actinobacteria bacterium]|nr:hypothetical protein [Actinomycetota bacterium]